MPIMDGHLLLTILVMMAGCGVFLRMVAREKRRREKHLLFRLEEEIEKEKKVREAQGEEVEAKEGNGEGQEDQGEAVPELEAAAAD